MNHQTPFTRTELSEPGYLDARTDPRDFHPALDPDKGPMYCAPDPIRALFVLLAKVAAYVTMRTIETLPDMHAVDPVRACAIWQSVQDGGEIPDELLTPDEYAKRGLLREMLDGEEADAQAEDPAPRVFTTTMRHDPNMLGEYHTSRHHMVIVDSQGNTGGTFDLLRQANVILAADANLGAHPATGRPMLGSMALIGTEDGAYPQSVNHSPDILSRVVGFPDQEWNDYGTMMARLTKPRVAVGSQYRPNGGLRKSTPSSKPDRVTYPRTSTKDGRFTFPADMTGEQIEQTYHARASLIYGANAASNLLHTSSARTLSLVTLYRGQSITGAGRWIAGAVRQASMKATQRTTTMAHAADDARSAAVELALAVEAWQIHSNQEIPRPRPIRFDCEGLAVITIGKPARGYAVQVVPVLVDGTKGKGRRTTTTAPKYVGAVVANSLASIR